MGTGKDDRVGREGPLDPDARADLLKRGWSLLASKDYKAVQDLLEPLPEEELVKEPELGFILAVTWHRLRVMRKALELARVLAEYCGQHANPKLELERANLEGASLLVLGRIDEAQPCLQYALEAASEARDQVYILRANTNLGIIADIRCDFAQAISYFSRAIAAHALVGHHRTAGNAHHCLAMTYRQLGMLAESFTHFDHAYRIFLAAGSLDELVAVEIETALLHLQGGDLRLANMTVQRALRRVQRSGIIWEMGEVLRVRGMIALAQGDRAAAYGDLTESLRLSDVSENLLLKAEVLEELAVLAQVQGDEGEMERLIEESAAIYERIGTPARAQRARARVAPAGVGDSGGFASEAGYRP